MRKNTSEGSKKDNGWAIILLCATLALYASIVNKVTSAGSRVSWLEDLLIRTASGDEVGFLQDLCKRYD